MQPHHGTPQEKENEAERPPMLVMDYMYMGRAKEVAKRQIIAARERESGWYMSHLLKQKGVGDGLIAKRMAADVDGLGY